MTYASKSCEDRLIKPIRHPCVFSSQFINCAYDLTLIIHLRGIMLEKLRKIKRLICNLQTANATPWPVLMQEKLMSDEKAGFTEKLEFDAFPRTHFAYGTYFAALQAKALGLDRISVYEFGVGWGGGLMELERISIIVEQETGVSIDVYGFDTGAGMPESLAYLRSFYWRKSLIYGFRLILTQKFPLKSMVFF